MPVTFPPLRWHQPFAAVRVLQFFNHTTNEWEEVPDEEDMVSVPGSTTVVEDDTVSSKLDVAPELVPDFKVEPVEPHYLHVARNGLGPERKGPFVSGRLTPYEHQIKTVDDLLAYALGGWPEQLNITHIDQFVVQLDARLLCKLAGPEWQKLLVDVSAKHVDLQARMRARASMNESTAPAASSAE